MTAETIAKIFINEIITRHSAPSELLSDQGANFMSRLVQSVCNYFKINKINTAPYNPKCDGLVERFNRTLCQMLSAYSDSNQTNWDLYLPLVLFAYRTSCQSTTNDSPFQLLYGREPRLPCDYDNYNHYQPSPFIENLHMGWLEAKRQIEKQNRVNKCIYDNKYQADPIQFKEGDMVRLKKHQTPVGLKQKLRNDKWSDPIKITKVISPQNVQITTTNNKNKTINVNNIKKTNNRDQEKSSDEHHTLQDTDVRQNHFSSNLFH